MHISNCRSLLHTLLSRLRSWPLMASALVLAFGSLSAQASQPKGSFNHWGLHTLGIENCVGMLEHSGNDLSGATDCVVDRLFSELAFVAFDRIEEYGKARFGKHFQVAHQLDLAASTGEFSADLDVVLPLTGFSSFSEDTVTRSFFVQKGVTRWRDRHGFQRNDVRLGAVSRYALNEGRDFGIVGVSMFVQENLERGHKRIVTGLNYMGRWGGASLNHYQPLTDWRPGRIGYEERAIAGVELGFDTDLTSTIEVNAAIGRWQKKDGSDAWVTQGHLGIGWQPHPWLQVGGNWHGLGADDDSMALHATITIPFGGSERPRWQGLGLGVPVSKASDPEAIWGAVEHLGQITVAERGVRSPDTQDDSSDTELAIPDMFGQGSVNSG